MPIANAYSSGSDMEFENPPPGDYEAICYQIIDVGTQTTTFKGQVTHKNQIVLTFELHSTDTSGNPILMKDGRPFSMTYKSYGSLPNLSMNSKANFRKMLSAWRGTPIKDDEVETPDMTVALIKSFLGKAAQVVVTSRTYPKKEDFELDGNGNYRVDKYGNKIRKLDSGGNPLETGIGFDMSPPQRLHPKVPVPKRVNDLFFFDMGEWDQEKFDSMKGWKKVIEKSGEYQERLAFGTTGVNFPAPKKFDPKAPLDPNTGLPLRKNGTALPDSFNDSLDDLGSDCPF